VILPQLLIVPWPNDALPDKVRWLETVNYPF
jgi:hypothetical protein